MSADERAAAITRLEKSFDLLPRWAKIACKHALGAPERHPETGALFQTFRDVLEASSDETITTLLSDFASNGDLVGEECDA